MANIKSAIKTSITNKGVTPGDDLSEYGNKIREIVVSADNTDYLCFEAKQNGSAISLSNLSGNLPNVEYSFNKSTWTTWDYDDIDLNNGDKVYFRGNNPTGFSIDQSKYSTFVMTGQIAASGNVNTLYDKTGTSITIPAVACFCCLFKNCTAMVSIEGLKLPATTLQHHCYRMMFLGSGIIDASKLELPATNVLRFSYI